MLAALTPRWKRTVAYSVLVLHGVHVRGEEGCVPTTVSVGLGGGSRPLIEQVPGSSGAGKEEGPGP